MEYRPFYNEEYQKNLVDIFSTNEAYMESALNAIKEVYGNTLNFIEKGLGINIKALKDIYLE